MKAEFFEAIGNRAPVLRLVTRTPMGKVGKAGLPPEWKDGIFSVRTVIVRVNFYRCPIVKKRLADNNLPLDRFKIPEWGFKVTGTPMVGHPGNPSKKIPPRTYLWVLGEGLENTRYETADGQDITDDPRLKKLLPATEAVPNGLMSYVVALDNILSAEELKRVPV